MQKLNKESPESTTVSELCEEYRRNNSISRRELERFDVKRGLRNADGTGSWPGLPMCATSTAILSTTATRSRTRGG